jgi:hypothetical protein
MTGFVEPAEGAAATACVEPIIPEEIKAPASCLEAKLANITNLEGTTGSGAYELAGGHYYCEMTIDEGRIYLVVIHVLG